jgi:hypothetical protein
MVNRRFRAIALVLVAGLSVLAIRGFGNFGTATQSLAAGANATKAIKADIAKQEMELAKEALTIFTQLEKQARTNPGSNDVVGIWSRRLVEATRKSDATKPEVVQVIKDHLVRMDERVEIMKARQQSARAVETDVLSARYDALEARAWLAEEQRE